MGVFRTTSTLSRTKKIEDEKKSTRNGLQWKENNWDSHQKKFAFVLGLKTRSTPLDEELREVTQNHNLRHEVFGKGAKVTLDKQN